MAATKSIIRLTHNEAIVKVTKNAADTATIDLDVDLIVSANPSDHFTGSSKVSDAGSTLDGDADSNTYVVAIGKIFFSVGATGSITITRNSVVIATLFGSGFFDLTSEGMEDSDGEGYDIVVTFITTGGTVYLLLKKESGYGD